MAIELRRVEDCRKRMLAHYAQASLRTTGTVWSDGWAFFAAVADGRCTSIPLVTGGGRPSAKHAICKWVSTVLGNMNSAKMGTYHNISQNLVPRYPAEFEHRCNRRYDLLAIIERLVIVVWRRPPMLYRLLAMADSYT